MIGHDPHVADRLLDIRAFRDAVAERSGDTALATRGAVPKAIF